MKKQNLSHNKKWKAPKISSLKLKKTMSGDVYNTAEGAYDTFS